MKLNDDIKRRLAEPFSADEIKWRPGRLTKDKAKGMPLAYIDARAVMDRLDDVVGSENWENNFTVTPTKNLCALTVLGVTKCDGAEDTPFEGPKGGLSDSFKRAAVHFGIGRYLYNLGDQRWLPVDEWGKFKTTPKLPDWALPRKDNLSVVVDLNEQKAYVCEKEDDDTAKKERMIEQIEKLFDRGTKKMGLETFMGNVSVILHSYNCDGNWKELPIEDGRKFYLDVDHMINSAGQEG